MPCEAYEFTIPDTGEVITLEHRWVYLKEGDTIDEVVREEEMAEAETILCRGEQILPLYFKNK